MASRHRLAYHVVGKDKALGISSHLFDELLHLLFHFGQEAHRTELLVLLRSSCGGSPGRDLISG